MLESIGMFEQAKIVAAVYQELGTELFNGLKQQLQTEAGWGAFTWDILSGAAAGTLTKTGAKEGAKFAGKEASKDYLKVIDKDPSTPVGRKGQQHNVLDGINAEGIVNARTYYFP